MSRDYIADSVVTDLFFISRIESTVLKNGCEVVFLEDQKMMEDNDGSFTNHVTSLSPNLIFVDLNFTELPWATWIEEAKADEETRERMREVGANLFMRKPFVIAKLVSRVNQILETRSGAK